METKKFKLVVIFCVYAISCLSLVNGSRLQEKYVWKQLKLAWPTYQDELDAHRSGRFIPENNLPVGIDLWSEKVFVTIPRLKYGVPVCLAYIQLPNEERSPIMHPYPNWEAHNNEESLKASTNVKKRAAEVKCNENDNLLTSESKSVDQSLSNQIVSPFRVKVDECDRLWILDSGTIGLLAKDRYDVTPLTLIVMDLNTDRVIHRFEFPDELVLKTSSFPYLAVDITDGNCGNAFVYVPDVTGYGLVVYSLRENRAWRIKHNFFHFDPLEGNIFSGGVNFQVPDGIFAVTIGNPKIDKSKNVYFHALSSTKEFIVSNQVLQNETHAMAKEAYSDFKLLGDRGFNGQATAAIFDPNTEIMFYTQINKDAVACWNSRKPYSPDTQGLIDSDSTKLVFPNSFFIDKGENLWVLSNRLGNFFVTALNASEDNFRILGGRIADMVVGTPCDFVDDSFYLQYPNL